MNIKSKVLLNEIFNFTSIKDGNIYFSGNLIYAQTPYMSIYVYSEYDFAEDFSVKFAPLHAFLSKTDVEDLEVTVSDKILFSGKSGRKKIKLDLLKLDIHEDIQNEFMEENAFMTLSWKPIGNLFTGFEMIRLPKNKTYFEGVICTGKAVYATDKIRLAEYILDTDVGLVFWLSQASADILLKTDLTVICFKDKAVLFNSGSVYIKCLLRNYENFPLVAIKKIMGDDFEIDIEFPAEFVENIKDLNPFSDKDFSVDVGVENNLIWLKGNAPSGEINFEESTDLAVKFQFNIDFQFLLEILKHTCKFKISKNAILFYNENYKHLISLR